MDLLSQLALRAVRKVDLKYELESGEAPVREIYALPLGHNRIGLRTFAQQLLPVSRQVQERYFRFLVGTLPAEIGRVQTSGSRGHCGAEISTARTGRRALVLSLSATRRRPEQGRSRG